jgi:hypothetical protein
MIERIRRLAHELHLDPAALLGTATPKLIEATPVETEPTPTDVSDG